MAYQRPGHKVTAGTCPRCHAATLTASWDDLEGVPATITVDPTPLSDPEETACVLIGRATYVLERTGAGTYRLSLLHAYNRDRATFAPAHHLPAHQCGARFSTVLPTADLLALFPATAKEANRNAPVPF